LSLNTQPTPQTFRQRAARAGLRFAAYGLPLGLALCAIWLARTDWGNSAGAVVSALPLATATPGASLDPQTQAPEAPLLGTGLGLTRLADAHTDLPTRADYSIKQYTVQANDTLFSLAAKFNLKPATILWGNPTLADNPNVLSIGRTINVLPIDGALRVVMPGDTLDKIAKVFHGKLSDIIQYPGNNLDAHDPELQTGQPVIIPNGWRDQVEWTLPAPPSRAVSGRGWSPEPGACPGPFSGANGTGTYVWPANNHYLSGWTFHDPGNPSHQGIDISAGLGVPVYASDSGVIVFAGVSNVGYGNLIVIDHGDGYQTAYGHLSQINVVCGQSVYQGNVIGRAGSTGNSTGPHLHFELRSDQYGRVNPLLYLH
jgi:murein DD-endopeptidase MepM/ murein hydrolase activator NlpD